MLLPSALPCDTVSSTFPPLSNLTTLSSRPSRPSLRRFLPYSNSSIHTQTLSESHNHSYFPLQQPHSSSSLNLVYEDQIPTSTPPPSPPHTNLTSGLQNTCRALQSLLGITPPHPPAPAAPSRTALSAQSSNRINASSHPQSHNYKNKNMNKKQSVPSPPSSPLKPSESSIPTQTKGCKRSRTLYESADNDSSDVENAMTYPYTHINTDTNTHGDMDVDMDIDMDFNREEQDAYTYTSSSSHFSRQRLYSTPKRRCRRFDLPGPLTLPFGLERADFASLDFSS